MRTRFFYVAALSLWLVLGATSTALAHTQIAGSEPAEGADLDRAPEQVSLTFDGPVEAEFSPLEVYDERGERVDLDNARLGQEGSTLTVGLREGLGGGEYTVEYRYTGVDGHPIEGSYEFSVSGASGPASSDVANGTLAAEQQTSRTSGTPVTLYGALGLLGILSLLGVLVLRRR